VIIAALLLDYGLGTIADLLNLKSLKKEVPPELEGIYKPEDYRKSQDYTRVKTRFGLVTGTFNLLVLITFWFFGGFNYLDTLVRGLGFPSIVNGLIYIAVLSFGNNLIMLPFEIYDTFVTEEKFGFNRTTPGTFISDLFKGLGLAVIIGAPLLTGILALFQYGGIYAWLYIWAGSIIVSLAAQIVVPVWIMPLFNKFTPIESGELKDTLTRYANSVGYNLGGVYVIDSSKRSTKTNAFFTGFGKTKRIALFDTLIARHSVPELVDVLAHEIGHYKKKHVLQGTAIGMIHSGFVLFLLSVFLKSPGLFLAFRMEQSSIYTGLLFFGLLYTPMEFVISIALQALSRHNEYEADRFAVETTEEPEAMLRALKKLSADNLSNLTPHPFYVFLNYSHPPLLKRLNAIQKELKERPVSRIS
jgi:STE24 endopeptidase